MTAVWDVVKLVAQIAGLLLVGTIIAAAVYEYRSAKHPKL